MHRPKIPGTSQTKLKNTKTLEAVSGGLITTLTIVKESLDGISPPGLKAAVGGLLEILKAAKKTHDNTQDLLELDAHLRKLDGILRSVSGKMESSNDLGDRIERLTSDINDIVESCKDLGSQSLHSKFFLSQDNAANIVRLNKSIDRAIQTFQFEAVMAIESTVRQPTFSAPPSYLVVQDPQDPLLILRPFAAEARFDSATRMIVSRCFEGTRSELLQKIYDWADDPNSKAIYWLCGLAGTGKSTIAQTVAEAFSQRKTLGASFFFSRDVAERSNPNLVFTTIAYQLGRFHPSFCSRISASVRAYPDSCASQPATQMQKLIAEPLRSVTDALQTVVIVMDALDECSNEMLVSEMLILLGTAIRELPFHVKIFVTSRPDAHIRSKFGEDTMKTVSEASILHDIDLSIVQNDIRKYLTYQLREIGRKMLTLDATWPTETEVESLVERAGGLFIYASASVIYIGDKDHSEPAQRLRILLDDAPSGEDSPSPYDAIDKLYRHILASSLPKTGALDVAKKLQPIIGTLVTLLDPLPANAMEKLMSVEESYIQRKLKPLHSILLLPDDPQGLIRIFHKSFPDFVTNPQRCRDRKFLVKPKDFFTRLALQCILLMNSNLRRNMCDIQYPFCMNDEIPDLDLLLKVKIGTHVLYACQFWALHLQYADRSDELHEALSVFVTTKLPYWLEVLSLSRHLDHAQTSLKIAQAWYKPEGEEPKRLAVLQKMIPILEPLQIFNEALSSAEGKLLQAKAPIKVLLSDCQSLLLHFPKSITKSACHIYHSALGLAPDCLLYRQYQKEIEHSRTLPENNHGLLLTKWAKNSLCIR
ncbi:hypothetical protein FRC03_001454 [Tulasnella sp. 419]|nr:hypothetical protein FRC03_001454 [Tulasnella sp. 419]